MKKIDYILDFTVHLGMEMLENGANLERVEYSMEKVCKAYGLHEVSIFALSTYLSISAKNDKGNTATRQASVPYNGIHLEKLRRLNSLSYQVCTDKPEPKELEGMLFDALLVPGYSTGMMLVGYLLAMTCLCRIFGGVWQDLIVADLSTVLLYFLSNFFAREKLNRIISNITCMFAAGVIALLFTVVGFAQNIFAIIITNAFYLIPGVPMVNAMRNILCGNEMNGILELLKVVLEVSTIVAGLFLAYFCFGRGYVTL